MHFVRLLFCTTLLLCATASDAADKNSAAQTKVWQRSKPSELTQVVNHFTTPNQTTLALVLTTSDKELSDRAAQILVRYRLQCTYQLDFANIPERTQTTSSSFWGVFTRTTVTKLPARTDVKYTLTSSKIQFATVQQLDAMFTEINEFADPAKADISWKLTFVP